MMRYTKEKLSKAIGSIQRVLVILLLGGGIGFAYNTISNGGILLEESENYPSHIYTLDELKISLSDIRQAFDQNKALFLDSRSQADYLSEHIPGALHLLPSQTRPQIQEALANISRDSMIVVYCAGGNCQSSLSLALKLRNLGFSNVYAFYGGWRAWKSIHYPVVSERAP